MKSPLRILHVCPRPNFSGLESYALQMAAAQKGLGHSVSMVVLEDSPLASRALNAEIELVVLKHGALAKFAFMKQLISILKSHSRPDIIHLHSTQDLDLTMGPLALARIGPSPRTRVVLQTHIWISHSKRDPLHAALYSLVDEMWCSSEPARRALKNFIPISPGQLRIIRYGRDIQSLESGFLPREDARRFLKLPSDATVVGTVARIDGGKGVRELYEASIDLMKTEPSLHLIWIGPPTTDDPKAIALAENILSEARSLPDGLRERVHFPGGIADSYKYLRAFDLFALPTYAECFSLALLEAQLASLPCLTSSSGGSPEIVRENETGWLFEPRSVEACSKALKRALADRNRWADFGRRAHDQVIAQYDFQKVLPTTIDAYREVLR
jgi:glycosyltransferase involved in cell wall biosynthesis